MLSQPDILVLSDFKSTSDNALRSAENIRKKVSGKIHVLHVSDIPVAWDWIAEGANTLFMSEETISELSLSLHTLMSDQKKRCKIDCSSEIHMGIPLQIIQETILKRKPDLVIMGNKDYAPNFFNVGGMVSKVVSTAPVPVLVVRKNLSYPLRKIAGLVDPQDDFRTIVNATEEFSFLLSSEPEIISLWKSSATHFPKTSLLGSLTRFHQLTSQEKDVILFWMKEEISKTLDSHSNYKLRVEITEERQVAYHLAEVLSQEEVEFAIMKRHQKKLLDKMFIGSSTRRMLEIFDGNILVLPP
jgi:nucleotide-binding universal stress UspA family protein